MRKNIAVFIVTSALYGAVAWAATHYTYVVYLPSHVRAACENGCAIVPLEVLRELFDIAKSRGA
jgi:hypothetical protein